MQSILFALCLSTGFVSQPSPGTCGPAPLAASVDKEPLVARSTLNGDRLDLTLINLERQRTEVTITNLDNKAVHYRNVVKDHNGFRVGLRLDKLDHGRYVVAVKKDETVRRQVILKTESGMMCSDWK